MVFGRKFGVNILKLLMFDYYWSLRVKGFVE